MKPYIVIKIKYRSEVDAFVVRSAVSLCLSAWLLHLRVIGTRVLSPLHVCYQAEATVMHLIHLLVLRNCCCSFILAPIILASASRFVDASYLLILSRLAKVSNCFRCRGS